MPSHPGRPPLPAGFLARPFAHRGLHGPAAPENSLAAAEAAAAAGYGIEIDLQPSADGAAMVFHDATLDRLTAATGPTAARPAAELSTLRLAGSAQTMPRLEILLEAVAGRTPLLIELKSQPDPAADAALARATARALQGYSGPVAAMSFSPRPIAALAEAAPELPRGLVTCAFDPEDAPHLDPPSRARLRAITDLESLGAAFLSHDHRDLARPRVAQLRAAGLPVLCWTIRSPAEAAAALHHADQITFEDYRPA